MSGALPLSALAKPEPPAWGPRVLGLLLALGFSYLAFLLYAAAEPLFAALLLVLGLGAALMFLPARSGPWRFLFPSLAAVFLFLLFPVVYTIWLGFTNYSSFNLLSYERAVTVLMANRSIDKASEQKFQIAPEGAAYRLWFAETGLLSAPLVLEGGPESAALAPAAAPANLLPPKEAVRLREALQAVELTRPDGVVLKNAGLRSFAEVSPDYERLGPDEFRRRADGALLRADHSTGFFVTEAGERVTPGWRVAVGLSNYTRIFTSEGIRAPMLGIFLWTVAFALLSAGGTFAIGVLLAVILQWPHLRGKALYRLLLILPYAVPSFISILIFRGLFNQNFGEINLVLEALFGIRPEWFTDGTLARAMIVIVNLWLGYPYMMLLATGYLQAVPEDQKKAAALEGASALRIFFTLTLPQIWPPFLPMLISSFAFNFNNIVLVLLMTRGGPDIPGTTIVAGQTDILGSFTYRIAFVDSGTQFGLAGAITFLIFLAVSAIAYANFIALRRAAHKGGARG